MLRVTTCSLILTAVLLTLMRVKSDQSSRIIIVGAGPAGIAAVTKLIENNITDVIVLEAENRIGGRIYTTNFADSLVDLGAEYCQGEKDNIVFELANKYNLLERVELDYNFCYSSGEDVNETFSKDLYNLFHAIYDNSTNQPNTNISLGKYVTEKYNEDAIKKYGRNKKQLKYTEEILKSFFTYVNAYEGSFSPFDVSGKRHYKECEGNQSMLWKNGGYRTVLDILMKKYPNPKEQLHVENNILTTKEVTKINWNNKNDSHNITIECSDKSVYKADYVIFTPSLGVLKAASQDLFDPPLPKEKVNAINKLGFGAVSKIFLHFPDRWWSDTSFTNFFPVWAEEDRHTVLQEFPHGPIKNGKSWLLNTAGFFIVNGNNPNVLVVWSGGEFVPEIERLPDDIIIDGFTYILNKFLGDKFNVTKPDRILHNKWYANPHFLGTYSFESVESCKEGMSLAEILLDPLASNGKLTLLFAGEATHPTYYSTVHGAIETGHREAQRIIDLYK